MCVHLGEVVEDVGPSRAEVAGVCRLPNVELETKLRLFARAT